ncbi:MAG TPA: TetR/AcrR family transcriptional regulator [Halieaceae bacterium]|jgi:AcrR family transcriptional regulator|uniref:TetR/AcrR family transcriptional regulator n=1 Tax=Haliea salexigens TaxID=287487 RepID=A0A3C1KSC4_9GAMM|nr:MULTISPECIES: TetR/AcrR family transcriptional regulator [Haliea]HAN29579.1 TetR/AcrR family transcriptional regulator [Haliea salexigens]HAN68260.1 TetR/AcrR family transcriptional regulator [Halieaceae bacterium]MAA86597.1 TetR/AcrR family transcriptional regulator [Haliea sp.]MAD64058.1 TetR/AcrR family transcriptional regulator [Haliea sp.]MAY92463.1 TetR/AcrR family transcriptional regulator [Haliea sp.]|tara:strand:- start:6773 stop:7435 length:663 start_codon:yes stop_codon:yes gene_type:complete
MTKTRQAPKRERILDVAEELFALRGYDGVTLRQIANNAGVDVALASYHFGKKLDLFNAVFERRAAHLNSARLDALEACQASADAAGPTVEQIIEAFLRPLELAQETGDPGWQNYLALIAYINNSPYWGPRMMSKLFDGLVSAFIAALRKALPGARDEDIYWCYHNLSGALTLTLAQTGRIDKLSGGKCLSADFEAAYDHMIPFVAAGFREVCGRSGKKRA